MKIVGFQSGHDTSYCVLENGKPIIHEELERFSREKEKLEDGLRMFFNYYEGDISDVKHFTFGNYGGRSGKWAEACGDEKYTKLMKDSLDNSGGEFHELSHHMCHAANAFFSSNLDEALILTMDGGGTEHPGIPTAFTVYTGKGNKIKKRQVWDIKKFNIGSVWNKILRGFGLSVGYPHGNQSGTLMAMACMGSGDRWVDVIYDSIKHGSNIQVYKNLEEQAQFDITNALQRATERVVKEVIDEFLNKYPSENICLAGGCSLNSVFVGKIQEWFPRIKNVYIPPVPYDSGLAIGSAQYLWHQLLDKPRIKWDDNFTPYLGRTYDLKSIESELQTKDKKVKWKKVNESDVLDLLDKQNIISVFGGGSESGRRALGNRSILADPRSPKMKDMINEKVKHRQWFRPFAPSILRDHVTNWFERDSDSPYMTTVLKFKKELRDKVPAVVHFDGSARLQTVTEKDNKWYYNFIKKWYEKTDVPILLNTSFNDREPIVETPEHALNCYLKTNIDHLYFYDFKILVSKI